MTEIVNASICPLFYNRDKTWEQFPASTGVITYTRHLNQKLYFCFGSAGHYSFFASSNMRCYMDALFVADQYAANHSGTNIFFYTVIGW